MASGRSIRMMVKPICMNAARRRGADLALQFIPHPARLLALSSRAAHRARGVIGKGGFNQRTGPPSKGEGDRGGNSSELKTRLLSTKTLLSMNWPCLAERACGGARLGQATCDVSNSGTMRSLHGSRWVEMIVW